MGLDGAEIKQRRLNIDKKTQLFKEKTKSKLSTCPVCDKNVSKDAVSCPHCGHPIKGSSIVGDEVNNGFICGVAGSIIMSIGVFCPIISAPIVGNINFFANGKGDGVALLIFAGLSLLFLFLKKGRFLLYTGLGSSVMLGYTFYSFSSKMNQITSDMNSDLKDNPFRGLADMAVNSVQIQWGWALLVIGAALLLVSGFLEIKKNEAKHF